MARWFLSLLLMCCVVIPLSAQVNVDFTKLKAQLQDPDADQRVAAIQAIARTSNQAISELLLPVLHDPVARVRAAAAQVVGPNANGEAQLVLQELLKDPDAAVRGAAAHSYWTNPPDQALETLTKMLTDPAPETRAGVISGLGKFRRLTLLDPLLKGMTDPAPIVRIAAARTLEEITQLQLWTTVPDDWHYQFQQDTPNKTYAALKKECRWDEIIAGLITLLKDQDATVRANALIAYVKFDKDVPADVFMEALKLPDVTVRIALLQACTHHLANMVREDPKVLDALCDALTKEQDDNAYYTLVFGLALTRDKRAIPALKAALNEPNPRSLATIIWAFTLLHDSTVAKDLLPFVQNTDPVVRRNALYAMGDFKYLPAEDLCLQALNDPDKRVCQAAIAALGQLKSHQAIKPLLALLQSGDKEILSSVFSALSNFEDPQVLDSLLLVETTDPDIHCALLYSISRFTDPRVELKVFTALKDTNPRVQNAAFSLLQRLTSSQAVSQLVAIMLQDKKVEWRRSAAQALSNQPDPRTADSFIAALKDTDIRVRLAAVSGLARLRDARTFTPMLALFKTEDEAEVRRKALELLSYFATIPAELYPALLARLKDVDAGVRGAAILGLRRLGDEHALVPLLELAKNDPNAGVRQQALHTVINYKTLPNDLYLTLISLLKDNDAAIQREAIDGLNRFREPHVISALITALHDYNGEAKNNVAKVLSALTGQAFGTDVAKWKAWQQEQEK